MLNKKQIQQFNIPQHPGCYQFLNSKKEIIYIGKAANLYKRVLSYWQKSASLTPAKKKMLAETTNIKWITTDSEIEAFLLEANLIKKHQPKYNVVGRDDKRYIYIHISDDKIPGVFLTRRLDKGGKYFGPFTSTLAARETLRALRKIWPYCTKKQPQKKPCFYYQINLCPGVCANKISRSQYLNNYLKPLTLFLEGKKKKILADLKRQQKKLNRSGKIEQAQNLKQTIKNLEKILAHTKIISLAEKYAADVNELAKILNLNIIPQRIEGYDISNIFGQQAVGSMVVFTDGEADKNQYRRFKIKTTQAGDIAMLKEVLGRRLKYLKTNKTTVNNSLTTAPDLIIIDGGKAQLRVAEKTLAKYNLVIPVIAIAKGSGLRSARARDKIYLSGQAQALTLSLSSPALHIIKRVRDEAHRFAVAYHRLLRRKKLLK